MEQIMGALRSEKLSTGIAGLLLTIAVVGFTWADGEHKAIMDQIVPRDVYEREQEELKQQLATLTTAVTDYISDAKIVDASQLVRDKELTLQVAVAAGQTAENIEHIENEIEQAKRYRDCLISERPNCKHLKPPE